MSLVQEKVSLAPFTSWLVGGKADYFSTPESHEELLEVHAWAKSQQLSITVIGGGSNVLISDKGIRGLVICLKKYSKLECFEEEGQLKIVAQSGVSKSELLKIFLKRKLAPALFLAGLPGDVGGGVVMNAGVAESFTPREFVEITDGIEVLRPSGELELLDANDLDWAYRHCNGWQPGIITKVWISWPLKEVEDILVQVREANKVRLTKQPLDMPSCGSVFVNPPGGKAAQLIDSCGLKGFAVGGAQVSTKHANFIVNTGGAKAEEIWKVIAHVRAEVLRQKGILLSTEVVRLGEWSSSFS